jgi:hypothetical protein
MQGVGAVGRGVHVVHAGLEVDPQGAQNLRLVVDDQHPGHRTSSTPASCGR